MIRSMTGYGRYEQTVGHHVLTWEARSVNHRYLEVSLRVPESLRRAESAWRQQATQKLGRGKVEISLRLAPGGAYTPALAINAPLAQRLLDAAAQLEALAGGRIAGTLRTMDLLRWPGVIDEPASDEEALALVAEQGFAAVLETLIATRTAEGARLAELLRERGMRIREYVAEVRKRVPELRDGLFARWRERLAKLAVEVDDGRLEQELAMLLSRMDVDEELDRLVAHLDEIDANLHHEEPVGRRLDFLIQELNREANTLASKSTDTPVTRAAVEIKVLIEQMREQVQNIE